MPPKGPKGKKTAVERRADKIKPLVEGENVEDYRHQDKRKNIPSSGQADYDTTPVEKKTYKYDPHLDPQLQWAGKAERLSFDVDTVSLHIHERISTQAILRAIRSKAVQRTLFNDPSEDLKPGQRVEFYKHDMGWTNRLILGDSLVVMNSLIERENMSGKVQMIYIDPPYGISYNSNFQPSTRSREVTDRGDDSLTREPEQVQAYRDTWALGIHSYLTYLRDRLLLSRELLTESGSIFVQISDENLHHVRELMTEVFGAECFVVTIVVKKKGSQKSSMLDPVNDYILWFTKSPRSTGLPKFRPVFERRELDSETLGEFRFIELEDETVMSVSKARTPQGEAFDYRMSPRRLFEDYPKARLFRPWPITNGGERANQMDPVRFQGKMFAPPRGRCWSFRSKKKEGETISPMERLGEKDRLYASGGSLDGKRYLDDFPFQTISNWWDGLGGAANPVYVVQTNTELIKRCMMMTTDPGDIVLDPTCGSGTTAFVSEQWGRRWITIDTSRVAFALARQRIATSHFPFYVLANPDIGVRGGFEYQTVPHLTLKTIANDEAADQETLFDSPVIDKVRTRVAGPFTTEAIPKFTLGGDGSGNATANTAATVANMVELLRKDGVTFKEGRKLRFERLATTSSGVIHAEGEATQEGRPVRVAVSIGPPHGPVTVDQVLSGIQDTPADTKLLIFVGFSFDPEVWAFRDKRAPKSMKVEFAHAASDILVGDLLKTKRNDQLFTVFGDVDVRVEKKADKFVASVKGLDLYDPTSGQVESTGSERELESQVAAWFLDTNYDRSTFLVCQAFFPAKGVEAWEKIARALKATIPEDKWEQLSGLASVPFEAGDQKRIAVKVIDHRGNEIVRVMDLKGA